MGRQYDDLQEVASRHRHQAARTGLATEEHAEWTDREAAHQRLSEQEATSRHLRAELAEALHQERAAQEAGLRLLADAQVHELELRELRLQLAASEHRNSQLSRSLARSSPASSSSQAPQELPSEVQPVIPVEAITEEAGAEHVLNNWVQKVCEFGMSGRCHSLTALFHFGYTAWKQSMHASLQSEHWGMESVEDISPGHIAEEEEKQSQVLFKEEPMSTSACRVGTRQPFGPAAQQLAVPLRVPARVMEGSCTLPAALDGGIADVDRTNTLLTKLHELRKTPQKSPHTMTDNIQKKVESRLLAPSSPCLSTATRDSGVNSRESTHCLTPRDGSQDESGSPVFEADKTWLTDKEIGATAESGKERELQRWAAPSNCDGALEELAPTHNSDSHWDQFKANAELFGYVSTFKEDLSQYSTIIDVAKVPAHARKKAERLAREIEVRHSIRGSADEEAAGRDEETQFSAVTVDNADAQEDAPTGRGRSSNQIKVQDKPREERGLPANVQTEAQMKVSGSFFHVEGVGLLDENLVRSNPWMLDQSSARNMPIAPVTPGFLSTQPQNAATPPVDSGPSASPVLSTAPVCTPHMSFARVPQVLPAGAAVMIDGLMTCPSFNGMSVIIDSYDAETNRYNVQLPMTDNFGVNQIAKIRPENLKIYPTPRPFEPNITHGGSASSSCNGSVPVDDAERSPEQLLTCARLAADSERLRQALEFCTEGLDLLWGELCLGPVLAEPCAASRASSSSLAPVPAAVWRPGGSDKVFVPDETVTTLSGLLCLRASAHAQLQQYVEALSDADELTGIQPTSADGYYWQSVALQGMGREHEALEALMSALEYEPQNAFYQQLLTALFEDISDRDTLKRRTGRRESSRVNKSQWSISSAYIAVVDKDVLAASRGRQWGEELVQTIAKQIPEYLEALKWKMMNHWMCWNFGTYGGDVPPESPPLSPQATDSDLEPSAKGRLALIPSKNVERTDPDSDLEPSARGRLALIPSGNAERTDPDTGPRSCDEEKATIEIPIAKAEEIFSSRGKEWGMPESPSPSESSIREQGEQGEQKPLASTSGASLGNELSLDQDDLVKQVMDELKQPSGGAQTSQRDDLIDIEIDSGATIRPASVSAQSAGEKLGMKLKQKMEEDHRRTLRAGGLTVKLPQAKVGEPARGTLTAKVKRVSKAMGGPPPETLAAKLKRVAAFLDVGEENKHDLPVSFCSLEGIRGNGTVSTVPANLEPSRARDRGECWQSCASDKRDWPPRCSEHYHTGNAFKQPEHDANRSVGSAIQVLLE
ncbi:Polyadenylate-binding protein-interacting protein 4 [Symbiodinium microadriaticum]|uniref:Polyadenylate-binding protein-interacting protein 4 n=1 Tax=Symbiodinium microadriaticum TaxID=2951 RepID=A0A1Q9CDI0_SYMMI|nr:Polyadenylate-binding protein-interacting protein 4 [Symbiodinium microadriaticum]